MKANPFPNRWTFKRAIKKLKYRVKAWWVMLWMKLNNLEWCDSCNGDGYMCYSCCGDDIKGDDMMMCPSCYEHCDGSEEDCENCSGSGNVKINK